MNGNLWRNAFIGAVAIWLIEHLAAILIGMPALESRMTEMEKIHQEILQKCRK